MGAKILPFNKNIELLEMANNIPIDSTASYDSGTTYSLGQKVKYTGKIYESASDNNTGNIPSDTPLKWCTGILLMKKRTWTD